ncbi:MAG: hypothetical protein ABI411_19365 [Tahibacter sp.]
MPTPVWLRVTIALCLLALTGVASADRRGVRVDGFGDTWTEFTIGSANCPGSIAGNPVFQRFGYSISGRNQLAYLSDTYCQVAQPGTLTNANFNYTDEPGLRSLFGTNPNNAIKGIRYAFLDRNRFDFTTPPTGFQWAIYSFPSGIQIAGLYGLIGITLTNTSFISLGPTHVWDGQVNGFNGEYFCFRNNVYLGTWNGTLVDPGSACLSALIEGLFANGFQ